MVTKGTYRKRDGNLSCGKATVSILALLNLQLRSCPVDFECLWEGICIK